MCIVEQRIRSDPDYNMIYNSILRQLGDIENKRLMKLKSEWKTMLVAFFMPRDGRLQHDDWIMMVSRSCDKMMLMRLNYDWIT